MGTAGKSSKYAIEDYLEFEAQADTKHAFYAGEVFSMAGGSLDHGVIELGIGAELRAALKGQPCRVVGSDVKLRIEEFNAFVYPDGMVICGEPQFWMDRTDIVTNPKLIVEVLSESTVSFDRGMKFVKYRSLQSLRTYILVEQTHPQIDVFSLNDAGEWIFNSYGRLTDEVIIPSLGVSLSMENIYDGVRFSST